MVAAGVNLARHRIGGRMSWQHESVELAKDRHGGTRCPAGC